jgi:hypothetical protein
MRNAGRKRCEKPLKIGLSTAGKAKVVKFDRRAGVVLLDRTSSIAKSRLIVRLVRDLLVFLRVLSPVARTPTPTAARMPIRGIRQ